ncbi:uncharacterized protein PAC_01322 [Phialocephala subalpina]|uniref:Heterokaryon incompatibility domain-containing protein n=1 Tax=Phialocephala subalpina TaxID=576137 RepID=A0A1L7WFA3_9HELO|nr:uncharacterized protein PAC_01322 [Phialocephala subalpina]
MPIRQDKICAWCKSLDIVQMFEQSIPTRCLYKLHIYDSLSSIQARAIQCRICYVLTELHRRQHGTVSQSCEGQDEICCFEDQSVDDSINITTDFHPPDQYFPITLRVLFLKSRDTCKDWESRGRHDDYYIDESQETINEQIRLRATGLSASPWTKAESIINLEEKEYQRDTFEVAFEGPRWSLNPHEEHSRTWTSVDCQGWRSKESYSATSDDPHFTIQLDASSPKSTNMNLLLNHFSTSHSSGIDFRSLEGWIFSCERTHPWCNRSCKPPDEPEERHKIRCIDVNSVQIVPLTIWERYVALSYVWGFQPESKNETGVSNPEYPPSIRFPDLPQTIQDAIVATRALGVQYLWVDALCIDQKSEKDKNEQLERMGSIYENSHVTIVASATSSSSEGIPRFERARMDVAQFNAVIGEARVVFKSQRGWASEIFDGSWTTRGWTFQEALLSRRCLFFGDFQVVFHCRQNTSLESIAPPPAFLEHTSEAAVRYVPSNSQRVRSYPWCLGLTDTQWDFGLYRDLLEDYSHRTLTYQRDVVNAFSGVLQKLEQNTQQSFIFGLPKKDLINGLLWSSWEPGSVVNGLFPTWTWANCPRSMYYLWDSPVRKILNRSTGGDYTRLGYHNSPQTWTVEDDKSVLVCSRDPIVAARAVRRRIAQITNIASDGQALSLETELRDLSIHVRTVDDKTQYVILDEKTKAPVGEQFEVDWKIPSVHYQAPTRYEYTAAGKLSESPPIWTPTALDCGTKIKAALIVEWEFARHDDSPYEGTLVMAILIRPLQNGNAERIGLAVVPYWSWERADLIEEKSKITLV